MESLYPSIPIQEGLTALQACIQGSFSPTMVNLIMRLASLVLQFHFLEFDGSFWKQVKGTAMGSNFAVVYACLFLCHLENRQGHPPNLLFYKRFIDDAFGIWHGSMDSLLLFLSSYGTFCQPHIRITPTISPSQVDILDIQFYKGTDFSTTGILSSRVHQKACNRYQYLPFRSWHPRHQKFAFIRGELRRYIIRESTLAGYLSLRLRFYHRLRARGYPASFLREAFSGLTYSMRLALLGAPSRKEAQGKRGPLVLKLPFCAFTKALDPGGFLNPELFRLCQKSPELQHIPRPLVSWQNPPPLSRLLLRSRFTSS